MSSSDRLGLACKVQYLGLASRPKLLWEQWSHWFGFAAKFLSPVSSVLYELDESPKDNQKLTVYVLICISISQLAWGQKGKEISLRLGNSHTVLL